MTPDEAIEYVQSQKCNRELLEPRRRAMSDWTYVYRCIGCAGNFLSGAGWYECDGSGPFCQACWDKRHPEGEREALLRRAKWYADSEPGNSGIDEMSYTEVSAMFRKAAPPPDPQRTEAIRGPVNWIECHQHASDCQCSMCRALPYLEAMCGTDSTCG